MSFTVLMNDLMCLVNHSGYLGIFAVIGLEYACFPIPSEVVLPFVGISIAQTELKILTAFLVSIAAGLLGSALCYFAGKYSGEKLLKLLAGRSKSAKKASETFHIWFSRYGHWAVLFARIVPLTRTYISIFAGASHMSFGVFMLYSSVGIALWNLVLISMGFYIGNNWTLINRLLSHYSHVVVTIIAIISLLLIIKKLFISKNDF